MKKFMCLTISLTLAGILYTGCLEPADAQNVTCATRPYGDSSNACASTAFVQQGLAPIIGPQSANTIFAGPTSGAAAAPTFRLMNIADVAGYSSGVCGGQLPVALSSTCGAVMFTNSVSTMRQGAYLLGPGAYPQHRQTITALYDTGPAINVSSLYWGGSFANGTVTISIASPAVITRNSHNLSNGDRVSFGSTGALPTGMTDRQQYYVINATANTFQISLTSGGSAINTSGTQSGTQFIYGSVGEQIFLGDNTAPQFGLAVQNVQNIGYRAISVNYFNGAPPSFTYTATGTATQGVFRSTSGPYWECSTNGSANSTCVERGPYIETTFGGSQTMHTYLIESDVANSEVFVGYYTPSTDTYATNQQQNGFYRSGSGNWLGQSYNGTLTTCDTGLAAESGRTIVLVMAYVSSTQSRAGNTGIDFYAGYNDTSAVYRCHIAEANVSAPTPQLTYLMYGKNTTATSVTFRKTHSEIVTLGQ